MVSLFITPTVHPNVQCTVGLNLSASTTYRATAKFYCTSLLLVYMNAFLTNITRADGAATDLRKVWGFFLTIRSDHKSSTHQNWQKVLPHPIRWGEGLRCGASGELFMYGAGTSITRHSLSTSESRPPPPIDCGLAAGYRQLGCPKLS